MDSHGERLHWPFFGEEHRRLAAAAEDWSRAHLADVPHPSERAAVDARCRELAATGWQTTSIVTSFDGQREFMLLRRGSRP